MVVAMDAAVKTQTGAALIAQALAENGVDAFFHPSAI